MSGISRQAHGAREPRNSRFCLFIPEDDGCQDKNFECQIFFGNHHAGSSFATPASKSFSPRSCYPKTWSRKAFSPPRTRFGFFTLFGHSSISGVNSKTTHVNLPHNQSTSN